MMRCPSALWKKFIALLLLGLASGTLFAADVKLEALLVWATNDGTSPKPEHRPIGPALKKKFENLPFKWKNYFEEKRVQFSITTNAYTKVEVNNTCYFDVKDLGECRIKVKLYGKDKEVIRHEKPLPDGETLIFAGDDKNDHSQSAWFIVIRHNNSAVPAKSAK